MSNYSIERAVNNQFYALFTGKNGEPVWKTTDTYTRKGKAFKAIGIILKTHDIGIVSILDNTLKNPKEGIYYTPDLLKK